MFATGCTDNVVIRAAAAHSAPTQPRSATLPYVNGKAPIAAPIEKPRYWNDAFNERIMGAPRNPVIAINRACCAGKTPQAATPQTPIAITTGTSAIDGVRKYADSERLSSATAIAGRPVA